MRGRWRVLAIGATVLAVATGAVVVVQARDDGAGVELSARRFEPRGEGDATDLAPVHGFGAAQALPAITTLQAYAAPGDPEPAHLLDNPTWEGFPVTMSVLETSADGQWLLARLPMRPNGSTGWVRAADVTTWSVPNRILVDLSDRTLKVFAGDSDEELFAALVGVGRDSSPTPIGDFYIDIVNPLDNDRIYGWGQLSVAGYSEVFHSFGGGIGQIAIHGWNNDNVMGNDVSNGCVRMRNVDIAVVADLAPLGTPVKIVE